MCFPRRAEWRTPLADHRIAEIGASAVQRSALRRLEARTSIFGPADEADQAGVEVGVMRRAAEEDVLELLPWAITKRRDVAELEEALVFATGDLAQSA